MILKKLVFATYFLSCSWLGLSQEYCKDCDKRLLTEKDLIESESWSLMRNEIYARHGYIFANKNLTDAFATASWYKPTKKEVTKEFNAIEKQNIALLQKHEQQGFSGFEVFFKEFRQAVLANQRQKVISMLDMEHFVATTDRDDYAITFDAGVKKAFQQQRFTKSVNEKNIFMDGFESCGRQFYFTKKWVNGKSKWFLVQVVAPG
ncbi:MAG: hypothetical protein RIS64_1900 [Bacteroidota bacterium]|jgi:hypothetical protein